MEKPNDDVRLSQWSSAQLTDRQKNYAAIDAISTLHVYEYLITKPDFSLRCKESDLIDGCQIDIVSPNGSAITRYGTGVVRSWSNVWINPISGSTLAKVAPRERPFSSYQLVEITGISGNSNSLIVPKLANKSNRSNKYLTLGDYKEFLEDESSMTTESLLLLLPKSMLAPHIDDASSDVMPEARNDETNFDHRSDVEEEEEDDEEHLDTLLLSESLGRVTDSDDEDDDENFHTAPPPEEPDIQINRIQTSEEYETYFPNSESSELGPIPSSVKDNINTYSAVLGDIFHFIDRMKISIHNDLKKAWKAALSRAFLVFDEKIMKTVTDALKKERNMSDKEIEKMLYFNIRTLSTSTHIQALQRNKY